MRITPETLAAVPKIRDVAVSPDGQTLAVVLEMLDGARFRRALWAVPADGANSGSEIGLGGLDVGDVAYLDDGSLLFTSRSSAGSSEAEPDAMDVYILDKGTDKPRTLCTLPGGIDAMIVAPKARTVVLRAWLFPRAKDLAEDALIGSKRGDARSNGMMFEELETRDSGRLLAPRLPRLVRFNVDSPGEVTDLIPEPGSALVASEQSVSADGTAVVTAWKEPIANAFRDFSLKIVDGDGLRTISSDGQFTKSAVSPDGRWVVVEKLNVGTPERAEAMSLWLVDLSTGEGSDLTLHTHLWPEDPFWAPDGKTIYFVAHDRGHAPLFRVSLESREVERVADGGFTSACVSPDGRAIFGVRSSYSDIPRLVRIDQPHSASPAVNNLPDFGEPIALAGVVSEVTCRAKDGFEIHSHLVMPESASAGNPAPLMLWMHGGTVGWNSQDFWLRCPYILVERGYAVLMVNPGRSTGYGQDLMQRGWSDWGKNIPNDFLAAVDEVVKRPDIDGDRLAAMGHSFGGHMANWIAGRSDRFKAIVDSAGTWSWELMQGVTPRPTMWEEEFGDPYVNPGAWSRNSPKQDLFSIKTPMLIIYGLRDWDVPISQALQLWTDLKRQEIPAKFLLFPDENHSLALKPADVVVYHETVLAFLDHYVLGKPWVRSELLG